MAKEKTPLYEKHLQYGGRIVEFGEWLLPVQYAGILEEHRAVRTRAGLFDVSHMGEFMLTGRGTFDFLQYLVTNDLTGIYPGRVRYSPMCYENGGVVDDLLVYMLDDNRYMLVVNASNMQKDYEWVAKHIKHFDCRLENISGRTAELALQGPASLEIMSNLTTENLSAMGYYTFIEKAQVAGYEVTLSRTGYTGEDGFEIYCRPEYAPALWEAILDKGSPYGVTPCGLGARDLLRLEAGMPLYGHELSIDINPLEAGLQSYVKTDKGDFMGREALQKQEKEGPTRSLTGVEMLDRGIPRQGYGVFQNGRQIGFITSGTLSPSLGKNIGLALVETPYASPGQEVWVEIREKQLKALTVKKNFYKRKITVK